MLLFQVLITEFYSFYIASFKKKCDNFQDSPNDGKNSMHSIIKKSNEQACNPNYVSAHLTAEGVPSDIFSRSSSGTHNNKPTIQITKTTKRYQF